MALSKAAVHYHLRIARGSAKSYACADDCGREAREWAFDEPTGYSEDFSRYRPLCHSCHAKSDGRVARLQGAES